MTNTEFIKSLSEKTGMTAEQLEPMVAQFIGAFARELASGRVVSVQGFGNFESREKSERKMYNPTTKSYKIIPKKVSLNFKMSATLKDKINS